jgi:eukaryotic-like serine/threonine-protein kinase
MNPGDVVGDRFRIEREAAHGGMGTVYRAHDLATDTPVAVKVMRRTDVLDDAIATGRFAREIELLAALDDPRIVSYVAHGTLKDGRQFLAEEWIDGESLSERLDAEGLTAGESAAVVAEVAAGLAVAHARGIVHRDVKPPNILFVEADLAKVKVIDFGIARRAGDDFHLTRTGTFVGTPGYISPEQARGEPDVDARTDVFALGCILYECLTGRPAFAGRSLTAVRTKVLVYDPPSVDRIVHNVPVELTAVLGRMLAKDITLRLHDGADVAAALAPFARLRDDRDEQRRTSPYIAVATDVIPGPPTRRDAAVTFDTRDVGVLACVVIGEGAGDAAAILRAVSPHQGRIELLSGGTVLLTPPATLLPSDQIVCAARAAVAVRPHLSGPIVLCGAATGALDDLGEAIDLGATALSGEAARPMVQGATHRGIRLDRAFVTLLRDQGFVVVEESGELFLVA